jgi:hypothetical protein
MLDRNRLAQLLGMLGSDHAGGATTPRGLRSAWFAKPGSPGIKRSTATVSRSTLRECCSPKTNSSSPKKTS